MLTSPSPTTEPYWRRRPSSAVVFWLTSVLVLAITVIRNFYIFTTKIDEDGDFALNSILVNHTHHSVQLVGNYSRVGFDHPGPGYIYIMSAGQTLFYNLLHIVPSQYNGQLLGVAVFQAVFIGLLVMSIFRVTKSLVAVLIAGSITIEFAAMHQMISYIWMPFLYMPAFALLVVAGAAVAAGYTRDVLLVVLSGALLIHGHVSFILFVGASLIVFAVGWLANHHGGWRTELRNSRRTLWWSLVVIAIFAAPLIVEVIRHYPGPWQSYYDYSVEHSTAPHSLPDSASFLGHFWKTSVAIWLAVVVAIVAVLGLAFDRNKQRRGYFLWAYLVLAVESGLFLYYISRGIDVLDPINYYTGFFYDTVPMLLVVFACTHAGMLIHERLSAHDVSWSRLLMPVVAGVVAITLVAVGASASVVTNPYRGEPIYSPIVTALKADPARAGREVALGFDHDRWPQAAGVFIRAERNRLPLCVPPDPTWQLLFTAPSLCKNLNADWQVTLLARATWNGKGTVIWSDADLVLVDGAINTVLVAQS